MRVSDANVFSALNRRLNTARADMAEAQERAGTGKRVGKPSDDPVAYAAARRENNKRALAEAGIRNAEVASAQLNTADEALGMATDAIASAKALAITGGSGALGAEQRQALAGQVDQIRAELISLGNTQVAGVYVFGGYADDRPPFDANGVFVGDRSTKEVTTYPGVKASASMPGEDAFGIGGQGDVFSALEALSTALNNNDQAGVRASLSGLADCESRMITARARVGAMSDGVEAASAVADRYSYSAKVEASRLTEIDEVSAVTDMLKAKAALEAATATANELPTGGLVKRG
jgi:flagellar hook-associated protein 3 FlgL